ncbi:NGFI-A-binding protein homolog isoform X4 [Chironomus tepperi]|uniref:NGFI-A-binding protein homolog isoform X3 n=1 Tax=Chironomus tepperi TaxID=113505 RepID=UPI00391F7133
MDSSIPSITSDPHHTPKRVSSSTVSSPILTPPTGKILSRNCNGTMVHTSNPSNEAELQLYRVLQRASLLAYYDTLLEMGGDDVQQLCDAGEEEFLEIMALVGMASKPLHVRRLQKALHEWMINPSLFHSQMTPNSDISIPPPPILFHPEPGSISQQLQQQQRSLGPSYVSPGFSGSHTSTTTTGSSHGFCSLTAPSFGTPPTISSSSSSSSNLVPSLNPTLTDSQISRIISSAERLARTLPQLEPRTQNIKKRSARELEQVIAMSESDPRRMDEIRKYSAIYGRFDCKRKPEKPLTLHEVCVNEAAAQICKFIPALLTRRDELFPLARQVVRDSGFGHSATIRLMSQSQSRDDSEQQQSKRSRLASGSGTDPGKDISEENREKPFMFATSLKPFDLSEATKLSLVLSASQQISQQQLKDSFMKNFSRYATSDFEDTDSRFSFSSSSSPVHNGNTNDRDSFDTNSEYFDKCPDENQKSMDDSPLGVQVISSSGGHVIAIANPALALSPTFESIAIKREVVSPDL